MRTAFFETLFEMAARDPRIWLLCGDLGYSVVEPFAERFPDRFMNVGVAEQNMIGVAAGLAMADKIPFTYTIGNFPIMRCFEQIRNDVCDHDAPVRIVAVGGGFAYGSLGYTHHAIEDIAAMRALPGMTVLAPGDPAEVRVLTAALADLPGPAYLRLGKAGEPAVHAVEPKLEIGRAFVHSRGDDVTLLSTGGMLRTVMDVARTLADAGTSAGVTSVHTVKPIDRTFILAEAARTPLMVVVEEHSAVGGLGDAVARCLVTDARGGARLACFGVDEHATKGTVGSQAWLRAHAGLSHDKLVDAIRAMVRP